MSKSILHISFLFLALSGLIAFTSCGSKTTSETTTSSVPKYQTQIPTTETTAPSNFSATISFRIQFYSPVEFLHGFKVLSFDQSRLQYVNISSSEAMKIMQPLVTAITGRSYVIEERDAEYHLMGFNPVSKEYITDAVIKPVNVDLEKPTYNSGKYQVSSTIDDGYECKSFFKMSFFSLDISLECSKL